MIDLESKKRKLQLVVALGIAATFIVALPLLVMLVKSMVLTIGAAIIGVAAVNFGPIIGMKFANWKLKATKAEAAANPIETMENEWLMQSKLLSDQKTAIEEYEAAVNLYVQKVKEIVKKYPARTPEFEPEVAGRLALLELRVEAWNEFHDQLNKFRDKIEEEKVVNDAALALLAVDNLTPNDQQKALSKIKIDAATDSVRANVARSSAKLSSQLRQLDFDPEKKLELKTESLSKARELLGIKAV